MNGTAVGTILGCATCAANFRGEGNDAAGWSILFLLGVILLVLGLVAVCMVRIARRDRALLDPELRDDAPVPYAANGAAGGGRATAGPAAAAALVEPLRTS